MQLGKTLSRNGVGCALLPPQEPAQRLERLDAGVLEQRGGVRIGAGENHRQIVAARINQRLRVWRQRACGGGIERGLEGDGLATEIDVPHHHRRWQRPRLVTMTAGTRCDAESRRRRRPTI